MGKREGLNIRFSGENTRPGGQVSCGLEQVLCPPSLTGTWSWPHPLGPLEAPKATKSLPLLCPACLRLWMALRTAVPYSLVTQPLPAQD